MPSIPPWLSGRSSLRSTFRQRSPSTFRSSRSPASYLSDTSDFNRSTIKAHSRPPSFALSTSSRWSLSTSASSSASFSSSFTATATASPAPTPPFTHPRSHDRYVALTRTHNAAVEELDAVASTILFGLSGVHKHATGEIRAASAWMMLEMIEAHFETTNDMATRRYDVICAWEPDNSELAQWANRIEERYALKMPHELRVTKLKALSNAVGDIFDVFPCVAELRTPRRNTSRELRHIIFDMLVAELRRMPEASVPDLYEATCRWARGEVLLALTEDDDDESVHELSAIVESSAEFCAESDESCDEGDGKKIQFESKFESEYETRVRELGLCLEEMRAMERLVRQLAEDQEAM